MINKNLRKLENFHVGFWNWSQLCECPLGKEQKQSLYPADINTHLKRKGNMVLSFLYSNRSHETQHPFHLLFSALIKRLAHKWEIMTLNSETPIVETTDSRWLMWKDIDQWLMHSTHKESQCFRAANKVRIRLFPCMSVLLPEIRRFG